MTLTSCITCRSNHQNAKILWPKGSTEMQKNETGAGLTVYRILIGVSLGVIGMRACMSVSRTPYLAMGHVASGLTNWQQYFWTRFVFSFFILHSIFWFLKRDDRDQCKKKNNRTERKQSNCYLWSCSLERLRTNHFGLPPMVEK